MCINIANSRFRASHIQIFMLCLAVPHIFIEFVEYSHVINQYTPRGSKKRWLFSVHKLFMQSEMLVAADCINFTGYANFRLNQNNNTVHIIFYWATTIPFPIPTMLHPSPSNFKQCIQKLVDPVYVAYLAVA